MYFGTAIFYKMKTTIQIRLIYFFVSTNHLTSFTIWSPEIFWPFSVNYHCRKKNNSVNTIHNLIIIILHISSFVNLCYYIFSKNHQSIVHLCLCIISKTVLYLLNLILFNAINLMIWLEQKVSCRFSLHFYINCVSADKNCNIKVAII